MYKENFLSIQKPVFTSNDPDPRCPSHCWKCQCDPEKRKLSEKLLTDVQNNPDPKYPNGCSRPSGCLCVKCPPRPTFTPGIAPRPERLDQTGFGFNTDTNTGIKNYFIKRGGVNYPVNLEQIPFDNQENLGLRDNREARGMPGASVFSFDSNKGLIYSKNYSILYGPFSIFDPVSRFGFSGYANPKFQKEKINYFIQDDQGNQLQLAQPSQHHPELTRHRQAL